jgi:hypothetical protein
MSQSLAVASHAPETNKLGSGPNDRLGLYENGQCLISARHPPHDITSVVTEFHIARTSLDVPQHAGHITRAGDNLAVIDKPTAAEITRMCAQFASAPDIGSLSAMQIVNRAYVVKTSTSDEISRRGISASHDPARSKWNSMNFVGGVRIPNDQFTVLRC